MIGDKKKVTVTMSTLLASSGILVAMLLFSSQLWMTTAQNFDDEGYSLWTVGLGVSFICWALLFLFFAFIITIRKKTITKRSLVLLSFAFILTIVEVAIIFLPMVLKIVVDGDISKPLFQPVLPAVATIFIYILVPVALSLICYFATGCFKFLDVLVEEPSKHKRNSPQEHQTCKEE